MRVLQIGKFFPPPYGGMESVLISIMEQLNKQISVDAVVSSHSRGSDSFPYAGGMVYRLASFGSFKSQPMSIGLIPWLRAHLRRGEYDLVHIHLPNPLGDVALQLSGCRTPVVITWHADVLGKPVLRRFYQPVLDRLLDKARAIVAATPKHFTSSAQLRGACREKFACVPFGFDPATMTADDKIQALASEWRRSLGASRIVLAVGRLVEYKGFEYLVRATKALPQDTVTAIVGEGPLCGSLTQTAKQLGVADRVHLLGALSREHLVAAFHGCDVFCLPSVTRAEAFGVASAEAMMCAKPVVCCELDNGVTYLNRHGVTSIVVPPRDPDALASALNRLVADADLRRRLGEEGRKLIQTEYSMEEMARRLLGVYSSVLEVV